MEELDDFDGVLPDEAPEFGVSKEEMAKFKAMLSGMSDEQKGRLMLTQVMDSVLIDLKEGMAGAATLNVARQLLKDNNIGITPTRDNVAGKLQAAVDAASKNANAQNLVPVEELGKIDVTDFLERGIH